MFRGERAVVGTSAVVGDRLKDAVRARHVERLGAGRRRFRQPAARERGALSEIVNLRRRECVTIPHLGSQNRAIMRSSERHLEGTPRALRVHSEGT